MSIVRSIFISAFILLFSGLFAQSEEHQEKGDKLFEKGDYETAIIEYSKSIEYDEKNVNSFLQRAMCYNMKFCAINPTWSERKIVAVALT
jgi:tetratricopeptide (TPR) repeat protein